MRFNSILENRFYRFVIPFVFFLLFWFFVMPKCSTLKERADSGRCQKASAIKQSSIAGVITSKYLDERKHRFINYSQDGVIWKNDLFVIEGSNTFDHLQVGDSIRKEPGSYDIHVYRNDSIFTHSLFYNCE